MTDRRQNTDTRCTPTHKRTVFVHCFREHYSHQSRLYTLSAVYSIVDKCLLYCFNDMWQPNTNERHIFNKRSNEYRMCSYMHHLREISTGLCFSVRYRQGDSFRWIWTKSGMRHGHKGFLQRDRAMLEHRRGELRAPKARFYTSRLLSVDGRLVC